MRRCATGLVAAALAAACASTPAAPPTVVIHNRSGADIESIRVRDCEGAESELAPIPGTELRAGHSVTIDVPGSCVDLVAYDRRGRVAAEQRALRALPGTIWSIY